MSFDCEAVERFISVASDCEAVETVCIYVTSDWEVLKTLISIASGVMQ